MLPQVGQLAQVQLAAERFADAMWRDEAREGLAAFIVQPQPRWSAPSEEN